MQIEFATVEDVEEITALRLDFIRELGFQVGPGELERGIPFNRIFMAEELGKSLFIVVAREGGVICSMGTLQPVRSFLGPGGKTGVSGKITNVFTRPACRQRGLAEQVMRKLLDTARELHFDSITLDASPIGKGLYEKLGFKEGPSPDVPMRLRL